MKFLDLFSGIGGFRLGMEMAGHECVGHCEIDKHADKSYRAMHNPKEDEWYEKDITKVQADELPKADVWCFGFPCQDISIAGKQKGMHEGTRSGLFYTVTDLIKKQKEKDKPSILFIENVKNLLSVNGGWDFARVLIEMDEIGYDAEWQVLNSKHFGVPQNRERLFIIGHLRGTSRPKVFPIRTDCEEVNDIQRQQGISNCLTARYEKAQATGTYIIIIERQLDAQIKQLNNPTHSNDRVYAVDGLSPTLNTMLGGMRQPFVAISNDSIKIRRLTPLECFRLQGFPDEYFYRAKAAGISDSQLYKQAGNSVTVNVIYEIAKLL